MKAILMSIKPKWCEKIFSGEKTIEVRKTAPKLETPFKVYVYCTNGRFDITDIDDITSESVRVVSEGRGKVIGEFICDKLNYYPAHSAIAKYSYKDTRVNAEEFIKYSKGKDIYGWHISDLKIYDKPRELGWFRKPCEYAHESYKCYPDNCARCPWNTVTRPPQSWQYVEEI